MADTDTSDDLSDIPYFDESDRVGYINRTPGPQVPVPQFVAPPNTGQIQRVPGGGVPPPRPAQPPGPGTGATAQDLGLIARRPGTVPPVQPQQAGMGPVGAPTQQPTAPAGVRPPGAQALPGESAQPQGQQQQAGGLAPGVPAGGIGMNLAPGTVPEAVALGTGMPGNIGIIGQGENPQDDPAKLNYDYDPDGSRHADGRPRTASGLYMITDENWRRYAPQVQIDVNRFGSAHSTVEVGDDVEARRMQRRVAGLMFQKEGWAPWAPFNPKIARAVGYKGQMMPELRGVHDESQTGDMDTRLQELSGMEVEFGRRLPGMIQSAGQQEQQAYGEMQNTMAAASRQIDVDAQLYEYNKRRQAEMEWAEAEQLKTDTQRMDEWAQRTPTRQAVYASAMHMTPLLALLTAVGGAATGLRGTAMLGALKGVVDGVNEGAEAKYEDAMTLFKNRWDALKEHTKNLQTVYERFADSYKDRADGYLKAADLAREVMNDKLNAQQLRIQNSYAGIKTVEGVMSSLAKTVEAISKAQEYAGSQNLNTDNVDYMARVMVVNPNSAREFYNFRNSPRDRAEFTAVRDRAVWLAKLAGVTPNQFGDVPYLKRQYANQVGQHRRGLNALEEYAGRFEAQTQLVMQYLPQGASAWTPAINKINNWIKRGQVGDPHFTAFENALFGASREHARVITGAQNSSAQLTNAASEKADVLLNVNFNPAQIKTALKEERDEVATALYYSRAEQHALEQTSQYIGLPDDQPLGNIGLPPAPTAPGIVQQSEARQQEAQIPTVRSDDDFAKLKSSGYHGKFRDKNGREWVLK